MKKNISVSEILANYIYTGIKNVFAQSFRKIDPKSGDSGNLDSRVSGKFSLVKKTLIESEMINEISSGSPHSLIFSSGLFPLNP